MIIEQLIIDEIETQFKTILKANAYFTDLGENIFINKKNSLIPKDVNSINLIENLIEVEGPRTGGFVSYFDNQLNLSANINFIGNTAGTEIRKSVADVLRCIGRNIQWNNLSLNTFPPPEGPFIQYVFDQEENIIVGAKVNFIVEFRSLQWKSFNQALLFKCLEPVQIQTGTEGGGEVTEPLDIYLNGEFIQSIQPGDTYEAAAGVLAIEFQQNTFPAAFYLYHQGDESETVKFYNESPNQIVKIYDNDHISDPWEIQPGQSLEILWDPLNNPLFITFGNFVLPLESIPYQIIWDSNKGQTITAGPDIYQSMEVLNIGVHLADLMSDEQYTCGKINNLCLRFDSIDVINNNAFALLTVNIQKNNSEFQNMSQINNVRIKNVGTGETLYLLLPSHTGTVDLLVGQTYSLEIIPIF